MKPDPAESAAATLVTLRSISGLGCVLFCPAWLALAWACGFAHPAAVAVMALSWFSCGGFLSASAAVRLMGVFCEDLLEAIDQVREEVSVHGE